MTTPSHSLSSFPLPVILLLLLSSLLFPLSQSSVLQKNSNGDDLAEQICRKTPFYDLCITTLHSNPLTPKTTDLQGIALVMVKNILENATETLHFIEDLIKQNPDREMEQALAFCAESYIPVVKYTLPQAADAVSQGRFGFASYCLSDAEKEVENCERKLASVSAQSPLGDRNGLVQKLEDVAAAIIRLLMKR